MRSHVLVVAVLFVLGPWAAWGQEPGDTPSEETTTAPAEEPTTAPAAPAANFVPWPQSFTLGAGEMPLTGTGRIVATDKSLANLAKIFRGELFMVSGQRLAIEPAPAQAGDIVLGLDASLKNEEAYTVTVTDRVEIKGGGYIGAVHGTTLLLQAVTRDAKKGTVVPKMTVSDKPHSEYTGTMVDIARQENSMEDLKSVILMMHFYRMRYLHLHLTDMEAWTFPSKAYPKLGTRNSAAHGGPTPRLPSLAEWQDLAKFADERGVNILPEIETVGHYSAGMRCCPEIFGPDHGSMNPTNPKFYQAMDTIMGELCQVFKTTPYIHIGCDETSLDGAFKNAPAEFIKTNAITSGHDLFAWHIGKMAEILKKYKKRTIVWEDAPIAERVPKEVIVMVWHIDGNNGNSASYMNQEHPVIQVTWTPCVYQPVQAVYEWNAWQEGMKPELMLGTQMLLWERPGGEALPKLRYKSPPRNEKAWSPFSGKTYDDFAPRQGACDRALDRLTTGLYAEETGLVQDLDAWLKDGGKGDEGSGIMPPFTFNAASALVLKKAVPGGVIRYTLDGKDPVKNSPAYARPIKLAGAKLDKFTLKARLFDDAGRPVAGTFVREYNREGAVPKKKK
ncbi:MAG: family 20 glycosylhydrolase [Planctomycetota bacterium]|nr:family 20 glycosylhydrolase [Planctomycetota bacterium]